MSDSENTVPYGYCQCGCGNPVRTNYTRSWLAKGEVKGEPRRFISGHNRRLTGPDYFVEDHGFISPCWIWAKNVDLRTGYGRLMVNYKTIGAHRWMFEREVGPIPDGLTLDHLCRIPTCVNPEHLEPVPGGVNAMRGDNPWAKNARKTHCKHGHEFTPENTYVGTDGGRRCRKCKRRDQMKYRRKLSQRKE